MKEHLRNGIIIVDKPSGPTSHQVAAWVRDIIHAKKVGHSGTLDPNVTGVLPMAADNATKVIPALLNAGKEYVCVMRLHGDVPAKTIKDSAEKFRGDIEQMPPVKCAVKRVLRTRTIYYLNILEISGRDVLFVAGTQAGTYIRTLCDDWGKELGVGAHMESLRRTKAGPFREDQCVTLHDLKDAYETWVQDGDEKAMRDVVLLVEFATNHLSAVIAKDTAVAAVCNGADLHVGGISKLTEGMAKDDMVAILSLKGELVALGRAETDSEGMIKKRKGVAVDVERVVMAHGTYPAKWKKAIK